LRLSEGLTGEYWESSKSNRGALNAKAISLSAFRGLGGILCALEVGYVILNIGCSMY